jgi:hypothetical protein
VQFIEPAPWAARRAVKAVIESPERLEPKDDQCGGAEGRGDDYQQRGKRLIPARR